jgi:hypothetical protein
MCGGVQTARVKLGYYKCEFHNPRWEIFLIGKPPGHRLGRQRGYALVRHSEQDINLIGEGLMPELLESISSSARNLDHTSILEEDTSVLLGVSQAAAQALDDIGLSTVFDFASSALFSDAVDICLLAEGVQGRFAATRLQ